MEGSARQGLFRAVTLIISECPVIQPARSMKNAQCDPDYYPLMYLSPDAPFFQQESLRKQKKCNHKPTRSYGAGRAVSTVWAGTTQFLELWHGILYYYYCWVAFVLITCQGLHVVPAIRCAYP